MMQMNETSPMSGMGMQMFFYASDSATILFKGWVTSTAGEMVGSCIGIIVLAFLYEGLKLVMMKLQRTSIERMKKDQIVPVDEAVTANPKCCEETPKSNSSDLKDSTKIGKKTMHLLRTLLYMLLVFLSYILMLVFMTYNVYLCLSVVLGAGIGYAVFFWIADDSTYPVQPGCCN